MGIHAFFPQLITLAICTDFSLSIVNWYNTGKAGNGIMCSQCILKTILVLCFASYFPVAYSTNLFPVILNIWFHNYFSFTMYTVVSPVIPGISSCPSTLCFLVLLLSVLNTHILRYTIMYFGNVTHSPYFRDVTFTYDLWELYHRMGKL